MKKPLWLTTLALCLLLSFSQPLLGATITVNAYPGGNGVVEKQVDYYCSLLEAIEAANTNSIVNECPAGSSGLDTLTLPAGKTFYLDTVDNITTGPNGLPSITDDLQINGSNTTITRGCSSLCILPKFRFLHLASGVDLTLNGINLSNGDAGEDNDGGALLTIGGNSEVSIQNCTISGNQAYSGGGIAFTEDQYGFTIATINNSTISDNTAYDPTPPNVAGGIWVHESNLTMLNSNVTNNSSTSTGGGIEIQKVGHGGGGTVIIKNSTISNNHADGRGGGLFAYSSDEAGVTHVNLTITDSVIESNTTNHDGGGLIVEKCNTVIERTSISLNSAGTASGTSGFQGSAAALGGTGGTGDFLKLLNCTISGNKIKGLDNSTQNHFSAINVLGSPAVSIHNTTISNNQILNATYPNNKYAVRLFDDYDVKNSIIAGNDGKQCALSGTLTINSNNFFGDVYCDGTADGDPQLGPLQDNGGRSKTHALLAASAAIGGGNNATCLALDQRKAKRPEGTNCDIGAYEYLAYVAGDINNDKDVDLKDIILTLQLLTKSPLSGSIEIKGDCNADQKIGVAEAIFILQEQAGKF